MSDHRNEIRCFCSRQPLMATYGKDASGEPYIHVKVYKQSRIYAELWIDGDATCRLKCRECLRIHKITILTNRKRLELQREVMDSLPSGDDRSGVASPSPATLR